MFFRKIGLINNISSLQKILLGVLVVTVDVFGIVDVKEVKNQKYLDLGYKSISYIPRRNFTYQPSTQYGKFGTNKTIIISNKVFGGSSFSNRKTSSTMGGQCVQTARSILWSLYFDLYPEGYTGDAEVKINTYADGDTDRLRQNFSDIKSGDLIWMNENNGVGHTFSVIEVEEDTYKIIESNDVSGKTSDVLSFVKKFKTATYKKGANYIYWMRFGFRGDLDSDHFKTKGSDATKKGDYIVLKNPKDLDLSTNATTKAQTQSNTINKKYRTIDYSGSNTDSKPWLYFLLKGSYADANNVNNFNGIFFSDNEYTYEPDLLPVAPLRVNEQSTIRTFKDSKYEIYAESGIANFTPINFPSNIGNLQYSKTITLTLDNKFDDTTVLKKVETDKGINEFRMISSAINNNGGILKTDKLVKILFSPTVIDDYYISWGIKNDNHDIAIGFWNSNGYDMTFENTYIGGSNIIENRIYESSNAVNKYFMTLGDGKTAEWHFTLSGKHKFYVNIPTGNEYDIENAEYSYNEIILKATKSNDNLDSDFSNWYILSEENGNEVFDLQGSESIVVEAKDGTVVVDALKLVATTEIKTDKITYPDTKNIDDEYKKAIDYLSNTLPIFSGYKDGAKKGYFGVGDNISRAEFSKVIASMLTYIVEESVISEAKESQKNIEKTYEDLSNPDWFKEYAKIVVGMDIAHGTTKKTMEPESNITYREVAKMIGKTFFHGKQFKPYSDVALNEIWENIRGRLWHQTFYNCFDNHGDGYTFKDDNGVSHTITSVFEQKNKKIPGKNKSEDQLKATREDVALFLYRGYMLWKNKIETENCVEKINSKNKDEKVGWGL